MKNIFGYNSYESRKILNCSVSNISSIYLLTLGKVKVLRNTFDIDNSLNDNFIVAKYGRTNNLFRRLYENNAHYGKLDNVNLMLKYFSIIDSKYCVNAENYIKDFFKLNKYSLTNPKYKELVIIPPQKFGIVKEKFKIIGNQLSSKM
jgi:hypothetical protein